MIQPPPFCEPPTDQAAEANRLIMMSWEDGRDDDNAARIIARAQVHATLAIAAAQTPPAPLTTVYRAYFETMPLGLYSTREAARAHCLADAKDHGDDVSQPVWLAVDTEADPWSTGDGEQQLFLDISDGTPHRTRMQTQYSVMPLTVATAYDPKAEG